MSKPVTCTTCRETLVRGETQWQHERTGTVECQPLCYACGGKGIHAVGVEKFMGDTSRFVIDHWTCEACAPKMPEFIP